MDRPPFDPDRPWCWATDAGWWVELPDAALDALDRGLAVDAGVVGRLSVDVAGPDGEVAPCTGDELVAMVHDAAQALRTLLEPAEVDDGRLDALVAASEVVAVVAHVRLTALDVVDPPSADLLRWAGTAATLHRELAEAQMRRIRARRDGTFRVALAGIERRLIDQGLGELEQHLGADDPALSRLLPTAYPDDAERQAGWAALVHDELIESRRSTIARVRSLLDRPRLDADELGALMRCCNDLRLVLGTRLDVSEEGRPAGRLDRDDAAALALYEHLGVLVSEMVRALRTAL